MWTKLAGLPFHWRCAVKTALLLSVVWCALFPNPALLFRQFSHLNDLEALIQPGLPAMSAINADIDKMLPVNASPRDEFKTVERYVYQKIKFQYDWNNWVNLDYWPTASEVWERQKEDCDGRAVLAASILRARGFQTARLVGNLSHVWVAVDKEELMGPQADKSLRTDGGKPRLLLPSSKTVLESLAHVSKFPAHRSLIIFFAAIVVLYHPRRHWGGFFGLTTLGLIGFILMFSWGGAYMDKEIEGANFSLVAGALLLSASFAGCLPFTFLGRPRRARAADEMKDMGAATPARPG